MEKENELVRFNEEGTEATEQELKSVAFTGLLVLFLLLVLASSACCGLVWLGMKMIRML